MTILIIGAGLIAEEYLKIAELQGHNCLVVGRSTGRVKDLQIKYPNATFFAGGIENWLKSNTSTSHAIIATQVEHLSSTTKTLLSSGCTNVLVEKPLTYSLQEAQEIEAIARKLNATINIAFNRRNYVSVREAKKLIAADGGVSSFHFDFTEATFRIDPANYDSQTTHFWGIANSSHVIDTAFYLAGKPKWIKCAKNGNDINWHPSGSIFTGMGETENDVPFTYHANWGCPGKWNIEIFTQNRKLLFSPMERLHQQKKGGFAVELVEVDYSLDVDYKPGFYNQVLNWLNSDTETLMDVKSLISELQVMNQIFDY